MNAGWPKTWNWAIPCVTSTKRMVGRNKGSVMAVKRCQALAPSMAAASYSGAGMLSNPARNTIMGKPKFHQTVAPASEGMTMWGSEIQGIFPIPTRLSRKLSAPEWGAKSQLQIMAKMPTETDAGTKESAQEEG